ncbi:hypothetical protein [Pelagibacterium sp.]|uniref:hypothetical protein n=1 Tax=Pelagibacterium sp. TaxID=1967288 RepID=UPI003A8D67A8
MPNPLDRFKRLFERKSYTLTDPDFPLSIFGITHSASGVPVTAANAMRVPAVAAAVELIATAIGTLPAKVVYKLTNSHEVLKLNSDDLPGVICSATPLEVRAGCHAISPSLSL